MSATTLYIIILKFLHFPFLFLNNTTNFIPTPRREPGNFFLPENDGDLFFNIVFKSSKYQRTTNDTFFYSSLVCEILARHWCGGTQHKQSDGGPNGRSEGLIRTVNKRTQYERLEEVHRNISAIPESQYVPVNTINYPIFPMIIHVTLNAIGHVNFDIIY